MDAPIENADQVLTPRELLWGAVDAAWLHVVLEGAIKVLCYPEEVSA